MSPTKSFLVIPSVTIGGNMVMTMWPGQNKKVYDNIQYVHKTNHKYDSSFTRIENTFFVVQEIISRYDYWLYRTLWWNGDMKSAFFEIQKF